MNTRKRHGIIIYGWVLLIPLLILDCQRATSPTAFLIQNQWLIQPDSQNVGLKDGWFQPDFSRPTTSARNTVFTHDQRIRIWWCFNDFTFTKSQSPGLKWGLRGSVLFDSLQIWLNGQELSPPPTIDHGSNVDLTPALRPGKNLLALRLLTTTARGDSIGDWEIFPYSDPAELNAGFYFHRPLPDYPQWFETAVFLEVFFNATSPYQSYQQLQAEIPDFAQRGFSALCLNRVLLASESTLTASSSDSRWLTPNPQAGSIADFQRLIQTCHDSGMYVILDIDCYRFATSAPDTAVAVKRPTPSIVTRPEDFGLNSRTKVTRADLLDQFRHKLLNLVEKFKIDGFRCRGAAFVPISFWQDLRRGSNTQFLLVGDAAEPGLSALAFDATYSFGTYHLPEQVLRDSIAIQTFSRHFIRQHYLYPVGASFWRAQNYWGNATVPRRSYSQLGAERARLALILAYTLPGNPVLTPPLPAFFTHNPATALKPKNPDWIVVLNNFYYQYAEVIKKGEFIPIPVQANVPVLAFVRKYGPREFLVVLNLSSQEVAAQLTTRGLKGYRQDLFKKINLNVTATQTRLVLPAWDYRIYVNARFQIVQSRSQYIPFGENPMNPKLTQ